MRKIVRYKNLLATAKNKPHSTSEERKVVGTLYITRVQCSKDRLKTARILSEMYAYMLIFLLEDGDKEQALIAQKLLLKMLRCANRRVVI